jgi:hypothetical protein
MKVLSAYSIWTFLRFSLRPLRYIQTLQLILNLAPTFSLLKIYLGYISPWGSASASPFLLLIDETAQTKPRIAAGVTRARSLHAQRPYTISMDLNFATLHRQW